MKNYKVVIYIFSSALLLLLVTNPSLKKFKEYLPEETSISVEYVYKVEREMIYRRSSNYLVYSIFERTDYHITGDFIASRKYLGIFNNFFLIKEGE